MCSNSICLRNCTKVMLAFGKPQCWDPMAQPMLVGSGRSMWLGVEPHQSLHQTVLRHIGFDFLSCCGKLISCYMIHGIKLFKYRDVKSYLHTSVHNLKHIELRMGPYVYVYIYIYIWQYWWVNCCFPPRTCARCSFRQTIQWFRLSCVLSHPSNIVAWLEIIVARNIDEDS